MEYRLLGPLEVVKDGEVVDLGVYKQRALLALLLTEANRVVSTDRIIDELWPDSTGRDRQNTLWVNISRLRSALEPDREKRTDGTVLLTRPPGYVLVTDPTAVDAGRFEQLVREGRALVDTDPASASVAIGEGLALWRGHALEEFTYEPFAQSEIARLEELRLGAVEDRLAADLAAGLSRELVGELEGLVRQYPLREQFTSLLMLSLHRSGRTADALRAFGVLRRTLGEELGLEPSAEVAALEERIVLDDPSLRRPDAARTVEGRTQPGLSVRGYEIRDQIGEGASGRVYRGYQPSMGREVAIRVIRPELANAPEFIRRFEPEARLLARLEHAHIVPILDYWREPDAAFVVMRYLDGGSLTEVVGAEEMPVEARIRILEQVGSAIGAAHRRGLAHGSISFASVLLDDEGNAYVTDFGAVTDGPSDHTLQADVEALLSLADELLGGGIDGGGVETVDDFLVALRAATEEPMADRTPLAAEVDNPYRGLRAFGEGDAERFFGRERLVERLIVRLGHTGPQGRLAALVGPSGAGKSSVVRAGLIPALRAGALPGSDRWFVATMVPGRHPFEALEDALLRIAVDPPADLVERLFTDGIAETVRAILPEAGCQVVIVVDQLEELFSQASGRDADAFMGALADAAADRHAPIKIVATLRADFYDHPLRHRQFGELLRLGTEVITPMTPEELERAVVEPAAAVGVRFQAGLVPEIISDTAGRSALPLFQYALTELFDRRANGMITSDAYKGIGGVSGALVRRADAVHEALDAKERTAARDVFIRLVTLGEAGEDTRRRALQAELIEAGGNRARGVLEEFGRRRLLTFDRDPVTRGPTVEIAHEAVLAEWTTLRHWIDDARDDIRAQRRLATAAVEWRERGQLPDFLLSGARLARYDGWLSKAPVRLTPDELRFLEASTEAALAEQQSERRRVRRLRALVAGVGAALVVAVIAGGIAVAQRNQAAAAVESAELATLISRSAAATAEDPELALLLALEANRRAPGPATEEAVLNALGGSTIANRIASRQALPGECVGFSIFWNQDRGQREFDTVDGRVVSRDPVTGTVVDHGAPPAPCGVGFVDTEAGVGMAVEVTALRHWVGPEWDVQIDFDEFTLPLWVTGSRYLTLAFGEDEQFVNIYDTATGEPVGPGITGGIFLGMDVSADGSLIALSFANPLDPEGDGRLFLVDADSGEEIWHLDMPDGAEALVFDQSTDELIAGVLGGTIMTIDPGERAVTATVETPAFAFLDLGVRPDGLIIALASGSIQLVDRQTGPVGKSYEVRQAVDGYVRPDGIVLLDDGEGRIDAVELESSAVVEQVWEVDPNSWVAIDNGRAGVLNAALGQAELVDLTTGERQRIDLSKPDGDVFRPLVLYPESDGFWAMSLDLVAARWEDGQMSEEVFMGSEPGVVGVRQGRSLLGARLGGDYAVVGRRQDGSLEASLVRLESGDPAVVFTVDVPVSSGVAGIVPTREGGLHLVTRGGTLLTYDGAGALVEETPIPMMLEAFVAVDPATGTLAISSWDGTLYLMDPVTRVTTEIRRDQVITFGFDGDGRFLIMSSRDGTVRLWDVARGEVAGLVWDGTGPLEGELAWYDPESNSLWVGSSGKLLKVPLDPERWIEKACAIVGRDLTADEWRRLVPGEVERQSACP